MEITKGKWKGTNEGECMTIIKEDCGRFGIRNGIPKTNRRKNKKKE